MDCVGITSYQLRRLLDSRGVRTENMKTKNNLCRNFYYTQVGFNTIDPTNYSSQEWKDSITWEEGLDVAILSGDPAKVQQFLDSYQPNDAFKQILVMSALEHIFQGDIDEYVSNDEDEDTVEAVVKPANIFNRVIPTKSDLAITQVLLNNVTGDTQRTLDRLMSMVVQNRYRIYSRSYGYLDLLLENGANPQAILQNVGFGLTYGSNGFMDRSQILYSDVLRHVMDYLPQPVTEVYGNSTLLQLILLRDDPQLLEEALDKGVIADVNDVGTNADGTPGLSLVTALKLKSPELLYILINAGASQQNIDEAWNTLQSLRRGNDDYYYDIGESPEILKARERGEHIEDDREREIIEILSPYVGNRKIR